MVQISCQSTPLHPFIISIHIYFIYKYAIFCAYKRPPRPTFALPMKKIVIILFLFSSFISPCASQTYVFNYTPGCHQAYEHFMALRLDEGRALLRQEIVANPYNLMPTYLADYEDCLLLLFNGSTYDLAQRKSHKEERLALLEKGDKNSPWYRLCKAGIYLHWAFVDIRFGENLSAATTFRKSFLLLKENQKAHPAFAQNNIFFGLEEAVVGTIPDDYKWIASMFGLKGNVKKGLAKINHFINTHNEQTPLRHEAIYYYNYLRFYLLQEQQEVWTYVNTQLPAQNNLMHAFLKANIALNYRKADAAIQAMRQAQLMKDYTRFPVMDFEMASALSLKLDPAALPYFQKFIDRYKGRIFVKDTWQKMAYLYYIQGNMAKANYCREQIKKQGSTMADADKQALRFANTGLWPNTNLLQARLLIDGGYYQQALAKLTAIPEASYRTVPDKLEYTFRLGRIYDELNQDNKALQYYQTTINNGRTRQEHFAARAALQMGLIYERAGKPTEAVARYNECLSMRAHDFQNSIDQQAKAGINRITAR